MSDASVYRLEVEPTTHRRCAECRRRLPRVGTLVRLAETRDGGRREQYLCGFACLARRLVREQEGAS